MIGTRIDLGILKSIRDCHMSFREGDILLLHGDDICSDASFHCEAGGEDVTEASGPRYLVWGQYGRLILDSASFDQLGCGVFEVRRNGRNMVIYSTRAGDDEVSELLETISNTEDNCYILEKREDRAMLLFPGGRVCDRSEFLDHRNCFEDMVSAFESFTGCGEAAVVCLRHRAASVRGLAAGSANKDDFRSFMIFSHFLEVRSMAELEAEYARSFPDRYMKRVLQTLTPQVMLCYCQNRIQGQGIELKKAVYMVYRYLENIAAGTLRHGQSWMLTAPSGSGKTEFFRAVRDLFERYHVPVPVVQIDLSQITETGFKGDNVSSIPQKILLEKPGLDGIGICFLDEADKKCVPSYSHNVNVNAAVQANLLTLVEGMRMTVEIDDEKKSFDSSKTMFVFMGAFQSIRNDREAKQDKCCHFGFGANPDVKDNTDRTSEAFHQKLLLQDIIDFGMMEELAGRMVQVVNFHRLSDEQMRGLIAYKTKEISGELGFAIELTKEAVEDILGISFGSLGIRRPLNMIRELAQNAVAEVFFEDGFDCGRDKVIIESLDTARILPKRLESLPAEYEQTDKAECVQAREIA